MFFRCTLGSPALCRAVILIQPFSRLYIYSMTCNNAYIKAHILTGEIIFIGSSGGGLFIYRNGILRICA